MRLSVMLFCLGGLLLSVWIITLGGSPRNPVAPEISAVAPAPAASPAPEFEHRAGLDGQGQAASAADAGSGSLLEQMQAALNSENPGASAEVFTNQLLALIRLDPWAAARFAQTNEAQPWHGDFTRALAEGWGKSNPEEAARWVAQIESLNERDTLLGSVCFQVARSDAARAIQILEQQGVDDDRRNTMLGNLAHDWAMQDLAQAASWAGNYPAGATRDGLFKQIALAESKSSPSEAARRVVQQIPAGPAQLNAAMAVLHEWSLQDVAGAAAWLERFPDGELKDFAKDEIARMSAHQASHSANDLPVMPD